MPFNEGPRHCGQFSASAGRETTARNKASDGEGRTAVLLNPPQGEILSKDITAEIVQTEM